jgi:hypothetical protein
MSDGQRRAGYGPLPDGGGVGNIRFAHGMSPSSEEVSAVLTGSWNDRRSLMSTVSTPIFTDKSSNLSRMHFRITARKADGSPLTGVELRLSLEGDGSFQPNFDSKSVIRVPDADGTAEVTWYRRSIFGRDIKGTLTVTSPDAGSSVAIEQIEAPSRV